MTDPPPPTHTHHPQALEKVRAMEREMAERQREFEKDRYMGAQALAPPVDVQVGPWCTCMCVCRERILSIRC